MDWSEIFIRAAVTGAFIVALDRLCTAVMARRVKERRAGQVPPKARPPKPELIGHPGAPEVPAKVEL